MRQLITDVLVVVWVVGWIWAATKVYERVQRLAVPGQKMESAGNGMVGGFSEAGEKVDNVPGVGNALSTPFDKAAGAAQTLADAGREQQAAVHDLAIAVVVLLLVVPLGLVLFVWLPLRVRWVRRATFATTLRRMRGGRDLLALRALGHQPLRRLVAIHPEPAEAWRNADPEAVNALASLELRSLGLRAFT